MDLLELSQRLKPIVLGWFDEAVVATSPGLHALDPDAGPHTGTLPLEHLDQSEASDGDAIRWDNGAGVWSPVDVTTGQDADTILVTDANAGIAVKRLAVGNGAAVPGTDGYAHIDQRLGVGTDNPGCPVQVTPSIDGEIAEFFGGMTNTHRATVYVDGVSEFGAFYTYDQDGSHLGTTYFGRNDDETIVVDGQNSLVGIGGLPTTINAGVTYFASVTPKFEIVTGAAAGTYEELVVIRHDGKDATAVVRRLGLMLKLNDESSTTESNKMGGVILDSLNSHANNPVLHLVRAGVKVLSIDGSYVGINKEDPDCALHVIDDLAGYNDFIIAEDESDPGVGATGVAATNTAAAARLRAYGSGAPGYLASAGGVVGESNTILGGAGNVYIYADSNYASPEITVDDGKVGVNITGPGTALDVDGDIRGRNGLVLGGTNESSASPGEIRFDSQASGNAGASYLAQESSSYANRYWIRFDTTDDASYPYLTNRTPGGDVAIFTGTAAGGGENEHFRVEGGDGTVNAYFTNAAVGIEVSSPSQSVGYGSGGLLEIGGDNAALVLDGSNAHIEIDRGSSNNRGELIFLTAGSADWYLGVADSDEAGAGTEFFIGTTAGGANPAIWVETGGNVGLGGITSPAANAVLDVSVTPTGYIQVSDATDSNNERARLGASVSGGGYLALYDNSESVEAMIRSYAVSDVQVYFTAGNVGIGTSSPDAGLRVTHHDTTLLGWDNKNTNITATRYFSGGSTSTSHLSIVGQTDEVGTTGTSTVRSGVKGILLNQSQSDWWVAGALGEMDDVHNTLGGVIGVAKATRSGYTTAGVIGRTESSTYYSGFFSGGAVFIDQTDTLGGPPCLILEQDDVDVEYIEFRNGTVYTGKSGQNEYIKVKSPAGNIRYLRLFA